MYYAIKQGEAIARWSQACDKLDAAMPPVSVKRFVNGEPQVAIRRYRAVPKSVRDTGIKLIIAYTARYNEYLRQQVETVSLHLPSLHTSNEAYSEDHGCCPKTFYNHRKVLKKSGLVSEKIHGKHKPFEVWISPEVLWGEGWAKKCDLSQIDDLFPHLRQNLPLQDNQRNSVATETRNVEVLISTQGDLKTWKQASGEQAPCPDSQAPTHLEATTETQLAAAGGGLPDGTEGDAKAVRAAMSHLSDWQMEHIITFMLNAWKLLWGEATFDRAEQIKFALTIQNGVFQNFKPLHYTRENWQSVLNRALERLSLAAKYYERHPQAYLPDPYAVHFKGKGYFDPENKTGFAGTEAWLRANDLKKQLEAQSYQDKQQRKQSRVGQLLNQARIDFERVATGNPRKEHQHRSELQLYMHYTQIFRAFGKKQEQEFAKQYLAQKAKGFAPAIKRRSRIATVMVDQYMDHLQGYLYDN